MPPSTATVITRTGSISNPSSRSAGIVTPTPKAIDSPALPVVWTMLFSRIVALRTPNALENARNRVIDRTAIGTDAETVSPTLRTRVERRRPEQDAEQAAGEHRRPGELRRRLLRRDERLVGSFGRGLRFVGRHGWGSWVVGCATRA